MACIDEIVTLGICPDEATSTSGFRLIDAPGISINNAANIATETYTSGINMLMAKKALTLTQVKNDMIQEMQASNVIMQQATPVYNTSTFNQNTSKGTFAGYRGVVLHKNLAYRGRLRRTKIKSIDIYSLTTGDTTLILEDGINSYSWDISLVADSVNSFNSENLSGFPYQLSGQEYVKVLIDQTSISVASAEIVCMKGCTGMPNGCGWANGWDGTDYVKAEGYGVNVNFYCECDYTQFICDAALSGEIIWLKWQINIFEEMQLSNRFDNWVIYNHDELKATIIPNLYGKYNAKWGAMIDGIYGLMKQYRDDCFQCKGIRRVVNI